jgi:hypothetical protein
MCKCDTFVYIKKIVMVTLPFIFIQKKMDFKILFFLLGWRSDNE